SCTAHKAQAPAGQIFDGGVVKLGDAGETNGGKGLPIGAAASAASHLSLPLAAHARSTYDHGAFFEGQLATAEVPGHLVLNGTCHMKRPSPKLELSHFRQDLLLAKAAKNTRLHYELS